MMRKCYRYEIVYYPCMTGKYSPMPYAYAYAHESMYIPQTLLETKKSPLGVASTIDPVGLVQRHLRRAKQGIINSLDTEHELIVSPDYNKVGWLDLRNDPGYHIRTSSCRIDLESGFRNRHARQVGSCSMPRLGSRMESGWTSAIRLTAWEIENSLSVIESPLVCRDDLILRPQ